jgi:hypothetical protein
MVHIHIKQIEKRVMFSENCSAISPQWNRGVKNIKINDDKIQAIYFSHRRRPVETLLTLKALKGRQVPFVNHIKYRYVEITYRNDSRCGPMNICEHLPSSEK